MEKVVAQRLGAVGLTGTKDGQGSPLQAAAVILVDETGAPLTDLGGGGGGGGGTVVIDNTGVLAHSFLSDGTIFQRIVKASAGSLSKLSVSNSGAANLFLKVYNKATNPVAASDVPILRYLIPVGGREITLPDVPFSAGISYILSSGSMADTDATPVLANTGAVNTIYK